MAILNKIDTAIQVTKTNLPPKTEYIKYLDQIWDKRWVTNNGPLVNDLERKLEEYFDIPYVQFVTNGTTALQLAIKSLELKGEIITTPYSYVATTSAILWQDCNPVFADVKENTFSIDPEEIEKKITDKTCAILATHVYGIPCDVEAIKTLAQKHGLKVIYDAAHCFGVKLNGDSVFKYGDVSATSFHATKIYHTIEGGAVVTKNNKISEKIALSKAFGHTGDEHYQLGINGKNSEFHAAIGLCNLKTIDEIIAKRKGKFEYYIENLRDVPVKTLEIPNEVNYNYAYFPVVFKSQSQMMAVKSALEEANVFPRRYFYPSLNTLPYLTNVDCKNSEKLSDTVLCLPLYHDLEDPVILSITSIIERTLQYE